MTATRSFVVWSLATAMLANAAALPADAQTTPAPTAPAPAAPAPTTPAPPAPAAEAPAATSPLDKLLVAAKPLAADPTSAPKRLTGASTEACTTTVTVEGGDKLAIDLKKMQAMAVNTNLVVSGGGKSVQMEFDGKDGAKQAADAEKLVSTLNDKCM